MSEHTPGPWRVYALDRRAVEDATGRVVADVRTRDDDARLIAAAPDLLAALELVDEQLPMTYPYIRDHVRAAIAKAIGKEA